MPNSQLQISMPRIAVVTVTPAPPDVDVEQQCPPPFCEGVFVVVVTVTIAEPLLAVAMVFRFSAAARPRVCRSPTGHVARPLWVPCNSRRVSTMCWSPHQFHHVSELTVLSAPRVVQIHDRGRNAIKLLRK